MNQTIESIMVLFITKSANHFGAVARCGILAVLVICFPLLPQVQALNPPPDGGYPGGNTAEGQNALLSLTSGTFNTGLGFAALTNDNSGQFNTALGAGALFSNAGDPVQAMVSKTQRLARVRF